MSESMNTGELVESVRAVERELHRIEHHVGELVQAAFAVDGNAVAVHNQRAELARLNAMRAEDAETIRQLRRELEEVRHGDE